MKAIPTNPFKLLGIVCSFLLILFLLIASYYIAYNENLTAINSYDKSVELPLAKWVGNVDQGNFFTSGRFRSKVELDQYLYVPRFQGILTIKQDDVIIFNSSDLLKLSVVNHSPYALIPLNNLKQEAESIFEFTLQNNVTAFVSLSKFILLDKNIARTIKVKKTILNSDIKLIIFGMVCLNLAFVSALIRTGVVSKKMFPSVIILSFFALLGLSSHLISYFPNLFWITPYFWLISPIVSASFYILNQTIFRDEWLVEQAPKISIHIFIVGCLISLAALFTSFVIDIKTINIMFLFPLLCISLIVCFLRSAIKAMDIFSFEGANYILAYLASITFILHDAFDLFGIFQKGFNLTGFAPLYFNVALTYSFIRLAGTAQRQIRANNFILNQKLDSQREKLDQENEKVKKLEVDVAKSTIISRFNEDLHDGILNYLSIINTLSDNANRGILLQINKLSRNATNEVRIILGQNSMQKMSVLAMLSTFKSHAVDPLEHLGIDCLWSMKDLEDYKFKDDLFNVELVRILQEATHNAVYRAKSKKLSFRVIKNEKSQYVIEIENSGGRKFNLSKQGYGIKNMIMRSERIGAHFEIHSKENGAIIQIKLP